MRNCLTSFFLLAALASFAGCGTDSTGVQGEPVATTEDQYAAYDKMIESSEAELAKEEESADQ